MQVRFSGDTKTTPSHRSRYSNDPSTQIRRCHVEKLLGMQSPPKKMAAISLVTENAEAAAVDSDCVSESDIEASISGVKPTSLLEAGHQPPDDLPSLEIRYLSVFNKIPSRLNPCVLVHRSKFSSQEMSILYSVLC